MLRGMLRIMSVLAGLAVVNAAAGVAALYIHDRGLHYERWETDSILLTMPQNASHDAVFLGSSRAYLFTRFQRNAELTEAALGMKVFNMALPTGGGVTPARFYLEEYVAQGNRAAQVVYFLDPFVLFTAGSNDAHKFVYFEPLRCSFLRRMILNRYPRGRILTYVQSKFAYDWWFQKKERLYEHPGSLAGQSVDPAKVKARFDSLYVDGLSQANFDRYAREFLRIADFCKQQGLRLRVIVPPTLLGPEPGAQTMQAWLEQQQAAYGFDVHTLVNAMSDPKWFYNLDHLNTAGVDQFMKNFVRPILRDSR